MSEEARGEILVEELPQSSELGDRERVEASRGNGLVFVKFDLEIVRPMWR